MQLDAVRKLVDEELNAVDAMMIQHLESQVPLTTEISHHLIKSGGKRIRPMILLLAAKSCGPIEPVHIQLASILEFIHSATLLHDDVVDQSSKRRGQSTANMIWGNAAPVLVGDFLYSRAFQMMVSTGSLYVLDILSKATNIISEGEVLQLAKRHDPTITENDYLTIINAKTAKLFEVAAQLGGLNQTYENCLQSYGKHVGTAFQLIDDVLDYQAPVDIMGKNVGDDLAEGKTTLPLLFALKHGSKAQKDMIERAIRQGTLDNLIAIQEAIQNTGAIDYTMEKAQIEVEQAKSALAQLPENNYTQALSVLADFAITRQS